MRKIILLMFAMMISLGAYAKSDKDTTVSFRIKPALSCSNCESKVKSNLRFEKGVTAIETVVPGDIVTVTYDSSATNADNISQALTTLGYEVHLCNSPATSGNPTTTSSGKTTPGAPATAPSVAPSVVPCDGTSPDCCTTTSHHPKK